jgi:hypothetical protein
MLMLMLMLTTQENYGTCEHVPFTGAVAGDTQEHHALRPQLCIKGDNSTRSVQPHPLHGVLPHLPNNIFGQLCGISLSKVFD